MDDAIAQIEAIGDRLKYAPTVYPVPHAYEGVKPLIDWAVMQDPFGNEFCLAALRRADLLPQIELVREPCWGTIRSPITATMIPPTKKIFPIETLSLPLAIA